MCFTSCHSLALNRFVRRERRAFTLVELLVVIGIIAILISILLPTLRNARKQAYVTQCSSNMRQVTLALMTYIQDNKGRHPAATVPPIPGVYPNGWWWPNELVRLGYIRTKSINVYPVKNGPRVFNRNNPFRCPEGIDEDSGISGGGGNYPTDAPNNAFALFNDTQARAEGFGIPSWYQLNCRVPTATNQFPNGDGSGTIRITPFIGFLSSTDNALLKAPAFQRTTGMVRKSAELLMIVEAANNNWFDQTERSPGIFLGRLGARHGRRTRDGRNAFTNMAFFDGHVALFATERFVSPENQMDRQTKEVIFYINRQ